MASAVNRHCVNCIGTLSFPTVAVWPTRWTRPRPSTISSGSGSYSDFQHVLPVRFHDQPGWTEEQTDHQSARDMRRGTGHCVVADIGTCAAMDNRDDRQRLDRIVWKPIICGNKKTANRRFFTLCCRGTTATALCVSLCVSLCLSKVGALWLLSIETAERRPNYLVIPT